MERSPDVLLGEQLQSKKPCRWYVKKAEIKICNSAYLYSITKYCPNDRKETNMICCLQG